jgi:hypothetical protein
MKLSVVVLALVMALSPAFAGDDTGRRRVRLGGISAGWNHWSGPGWYGSPWGYVPGFYRTVGWGMPWWGLYDPFWSNPYLHSGLYRGFASSGPNMGQIRLDAPKGATVYLDGALAGSAEKLRSMWLEPGIYELQVTGEDGDAYRKKVYVLSGKTLNIRAALTPGKDVTQ